jgi:single-strand DNA-binding protein
MNNVSLIGRLTADPELKYTQNDKAYTRFTVAVDRPVKSGEEKQADFISVVAWNKTAEFICKYFQKGQRIALTGSIRTGSYTDKDGNKRYSYDVWAGGVEFCEAAKKDTAERTSKKAEQAQQRAEEYMDVSDDDLPF